MKIIILFLLFQTSLVFGQISELDKCGLDDNPMVTNYEAGYFNEVFNDKKGTFDFSDKKVAFFGGSAGTTRSTKSGYFFGLKKSNDSERDIHAWQANGTQLLILTEEEKQLSGGYDAILVSWSKILKEGKSRRKLVVSLKEP